MRFGRAIFLTSRGMFIQVALMAGAQIWLARLLGPAEIGPINLANRLAQYFQPIGEAGLMSAVVYYGLPLLGEERRQVVNATFRITLSINLVLVLFLLVAGDWFNRTFLGSVLVGYSVPIALAVLSLAFLGVYRGVLILYKRFEMSSALSILQGLAMVFIGVVPVYLFSRSSSLALWCWASAIVVMLLSVIVWHRKDLTLFVSPPPRHLYRPLLTYGLPRALGTFVARMAMSVDMLIVASMLDARAFGLYSTAKGASLLLRILFDPIGEASFPYFREMVAEGHSAQLDRVTSQIVVVVVSTCLYASSVVIACAPEIVRFVWGQSYEAMYPSLQILTPGLFGISLYAGLRHLLNSLTAKPIGLYAMAVATAVNAGGAALLTGRAGMEGAAVAATLAMLVLGTVTVGYIQYRGIRALTIPACAIMLAATAIFGLISAGIFVLHLPIVAKVPLAAAVGGVPYLLMLRRTAPDLWHRIVERASGFSARLGRRD